MALSKHPRNTRAMESEIDKIELSVRASNTLKSLGVETLGDLVQLTEPGLRRTRNCGKKTINELKAVLGDYGLRLGMTLDEVMEVYIKTRREHASIRNHEQGDRPATD